MKTVKNSMYCFRGYDVLETNFDCCRKKTFNSRRLWCLQSILTLPAPFHRDVRRNSGAATK